MEPFYSSINGRERTGRLLARVTPEDIENAKKNKGKIRFDGGFLFVSETCAEAKRAIQNGLGFNVYRDLYSIAK